MVCVRACVRVCVYFMLVAQGSHDSGSEEAGDRTCKVRKTARIRSRYNQVPHLSQDTKWESNKITINITNKTKRSGDHCTRQQ